MSGQAVPRNDDGAVNPLLQLRRMPCRFIQIGESATHQQIVISLLN
jgi:hypothetical protein